jgi:hypothetical protein
MPTVPPATKATTSFRCMVVSLFLPSMVRFPPPRRDAGDTRRSVVMSLESPLAGLLAGNLAALIVGEATERVTGGADQRHTLPGSNVLDQFARGSPALLRSAGLVGDEHLAYVLRSV